MSNDSDYTSDSGNDIYYRLYLSPHTNEPVVVCMQWFDEYDYEESRFLSPRKFSDEKVAELALERIKNPPFQQVDTLWDLMDMIKRSFSVDEMREVRLWDANDGSRLLVQIDPVHKQVIFAKTSKL